MMQISPEIQLFIREHSSDDVRVLALQAKKYPDIDMPTVITQIAGRKVAAEKIPSWWEIEKIWYPKHLSLEQCSSEITARYKARLCSGRFTDRPHRRLRHRLFFSCHRIQIRHLRRTSGGTLRNSST
mgnify:CR=1 FL=1